MTPREGNSRRGMLPASLGLTPESVIFASTGQVTASKRLDLALRTFARLLNSHPQSRYLIVGQETAGINLDGLIDELGLAEVVYRTGYVTGLNEFGDWTSTADIIVNLRQPTLGETSAAVLRAMAAGRPTIVFDHGWYSELPEDACLQVPLQDEDALFEAMISLAESPKRRREIGRQAVDYVKSQLAPEACAAHYLTFLNGLLMNLNEKFSKV
jgi:glycosyltransferase involved in cell wall biosynthesis